MSKPHYIANLMDVNDVAEALLVSPHSIRRWAAQKKLRKMKLGSRTLFDPEEVARFIQAARAAASEPSADAVTEGVAGGNER